MDVTIFDKKRLPSRHVTEGPEQAPHRSYSYAMGLPQEQIDQPYVGVVSCWNKAAPCNISLMRQAQTVKKGVAEGHGTPREFRTITVTDGIAMGHQGMKSSPVSREVIADSIEVTMRGHCYDAMVGIAGCDKSLPGMMMARVRLNVPSIFMYGGSILPGKFKGRDVTVVDVFEAVEQHSAGNMSDEELHELECVACPSDGSCGGQFTADTKAYESRDRFAHESGRGVMQLPAQNMRPRGIDGDMISIDAENGRLDLDGAAEERAARRAEWTPRQTDYRSRILSKYAQQVGSARMGAVTHPGAKSEVIVYADQ